MLAAISGCSNWLMPHDTGLSGRTTDLGSVKVFHTEVLGFEMRSVPRSSKAPGATIS